MDNLPKDEQAYLDALKKKAEEDRKLALLAHQEADEAAKAASAPATDPVENAAKLSGLQIKPKKSHGGLIAVIVILAACAAAFLIGYRIIREKTGSLLGHTTASVADSLANNGLVWNKVDFVNAVEKASREKEDLVVYEEDVETTTEVSTALLNWDIFKKTKKIHSFGTGAYTVAMSGIASDAIDVDTDKKTVTVRIPRTVLSYLDIDANKTTFEDTEHALLAFGDLELTEEQQNKVDEDIRSAMLKKLTTETSFKKADSAGLKKVKALLTAAVSSVSDSFRLTVKYDTTERKDSPAAMTDSLPAE